MKTKPVITILDHLAVWLNYYYKYFSLVFSLKRLHVDAVASAKVAIMTSWTIADQLVTADSLHHATALNS